MIVHLVSFDLTGKSLCGLSGYLTTTMNLSQVTCNDCKNIFVAGPK